MLNLKFQTCENVYLLKRIYMYVTRAVLLKEYKQANRLPLLCLACKADRKNGQWPTARCLHYICRKNIILSLELHRDSTEDLRKDKPCLIISIQPYLVNLCRWLPFSLGHNNIHHQTSSKSSHNGSLPFQGYPFCPVKFYIPTDKSTTFEQS